MSTRNDAFDSMLERSIDEVFKKVGWKKMISCYPELFAREESKRGVKDVHTNLGKWYRDRTMKACNEFLSEKNVHENIIRLQKAIDDAEARKLRNERNETLGPFDGPLQINHISPRDLTACILKNSRQEQIDKLETEITEIDMQVTEVDKEIIAKQAQVDQLWNQITDICDRLRTQ